MKFISKIMIVTLSVGLIISCGGDDEDTTPPTVTTFTPSASATEIEPTTTVTATFDEPMDEDSISVTTLQLNSAEGSVDAAVAYDAETNTAILTPTDRLLFLTEYTVLITNEVTDVAGNALEANTSWSFTTRDGAWQESTVQLEPEHSGIGDVFLAVESSGDAFAVWEADQSIYLNRYSASNGEWKDSDDPILISTNLSEGAALSLSQSENGFIAWRGLTSLAYNIYFTGCDIEDGCIDPINVTNDEGEYRDPTIAQFGEDIAIGWTIDYDLPDSVGLQSVVCNIDNECDDIADIRAVNADSNSDINTLLLFGTENRLVYIWMEDPLGTGDYTMTSNIYDRDTDAMIRDTTNPEYFSDNEMTENDSVDAAIDLVNGKAIAVWSQNSKVYASIISSIDEVTDEADWWSTPVELGDGSVPKVTFLPNGDAIVIWLVENISQINLVTKEYLASEGTWSDEPTVIEADISESILHEPTIAIDEQGNGLIAYKTGSGTPIHVARYLFSSRSWQDPVTPSPELVGDVSSDMPAIGIDSFGQAILFWGQAVANDGTGTFARVNMFR